MKKFLIAFSLLVAAASSYAECQIESVYSPSVGGWIQAQVCRNDQQPMYIQSYTPPPQVIIVERRPDPVEYIIPFAAGAILGGVIFREDHHHHHYNGGFHPTNPSKRHRR